MRRTCCLTIAILTAWCLTRRHHTPHHHHMPRTKSTAAKPAAKATACGWCGSTDITVNKDGNVSPHKMPSNTLGNQGTDCPGSGHPPL